MKRIIRLNAVKAKNEASNSERAGYLHPNQVSEVVTTCGGTVIAVPTKKVNMSVAGSLTNSASLQKILNQQPSVVPYLVVLSSIGFLVSSSIWAWNTTVEEASLLFSPRFTSQNNPENYQTAIKVIPKQPIKTSAHIKYHSKQTRKVNIHTYRVADMFFEE